MQKGHLYFFGAKRLPANFGDPTGQLAPNGDSPSGDRLTRFSFHSSCRSATQAEGPGKDSLVGNFIEFFYALENSMPKLYHLEIGKNISPIGVCQPTVMEGQWVAVNSRTRIATAYCHLEEKGYEIIFQF